MCEQLAEGRYLATKRLGDLRPVKSQANALTIAPPATLQNSALKTFVADNL